MDELHTGRLYLRSLRETDAFRIFSCWAGDPEVTRYLTWNPHSSPDVTKDIVAHWIKEYDKEDTFRWGIERTDTGELIGMIDVVGFAGGDPVIGYVLGKDYWNCGYMSEALKAASAYLFSRGYRRILIEADENNAASNKVIAKNGFVLTHKETKPCSRFKPETVTVNWYCLTENN